MAPTILRSFMGMEAFGSVAVPGPEGSWLEQDWRRALCFAMAEQIQEPALTRTPSIYRRAVLALAFAVFGLWRLPASAQPATAPVTVFAAASLKNALDEALAAYTARTGVPARASYAASSAIARQIEQGAPADLFISADVDWMDYLAGKGLIAAGSRRDLLSNHLALVAPAASSISLRIARGMALAAALGADRLAVAGPDVPAGRYAQSSLTALGVWDSVKDRLARGESVRATMAFVAMGETPLGIVYDTDAKVEPRVRVVALFPDDSHPPIVYPAAQVAGARSPHAADCLAFLEGPEAGAIFRRYGFITKSAP
jgi:molybdate transport system substrate-binding protein